MILVHDTWLLLWCCQSWVYLLLEIRDHQHQLTHVMCCISILCGLSLIVKSGCIQYDLGDNTKVKTTMATLTLCCSKLVLFKGVYNSRHNYIYLLFSLNFLRLFVSVIKGHPLPSIRNTSRLPTSNQVLHFLVAMALLGSHRCQLLTIILLTSASKLRIYLTSH